MKDEYLNIFVECCQLLTWKAIKECFLLQIMPFSFGIEILCSYFQSP